MDAVASLYAAAQLEQLGVLAVCDRLVELYLDGGLPIGGTGDAAALLDAYWLGRAERIRDEERLQLYEQTVGLGFEHLLGRLAAAITDYDAAGRDAEVAQTAAELRADIDAHLADATREAVALVHAQLGDALAILSEPEILEAYGARDPWQLVDHLSRLELGRTREVVRHQALAAAGTALLGWLASGEATVAEEIADAAESFVTAAAMPPG